jgi:hypothetical protein
MSCLQAVAKPVTLFPYSRWYAELPSLAMRYKENDPGPHLYLTDFLEPEVARAISREFPAPATDAWTHYLHHNENKHGMTKRELFPPGIGEVADELNSPRFVSWLSALTGIPSLIADPGLEGGGLHKSGPGGFLNMHTDFSKHHYHTNWRRRLNLILYLSEGWKEEWGGSIELWDGQMRRCAVKYPPFLNGALIFNTTNKSYHGFPEPLQCPEHQTRKSLAFYYYTEDAKSPARSTNYRGRPNDGLAKKTLIWLDKEAVDLYSRAKARFGFSDDFASRILGILSRKKEGRI